MARRRVFIYVQALSGTGHFVRMYEIARALQPAHDVLLLDGGRPIPRPDAPVARLVVPGVCRGSDGELAAVDGRPTAEVLAERRDALAAAVAALRPDVVLVEDYPFSKWEMAAEIRAVLERARRASPGVQVISCLRDIGTRKRRRLDGDDLPARVRQTLAGAFDLVLVHADPAIVRVEDHLPWAADLPVPIRYTGYVAQAAPPRPPADRTRRVVVSTGGAAADTLIPLAISAWERLLPDLGVSAELVVFLPAFAPAAELARWRAATREPTIRFAPFSADFLDWLAAADVSVSHAGYNTCANLLATGTPAVLLPNPGMGDQVPRAALLERLGLATMLDLETVGPAELAQAIRGRLAAPRPAHAIDLSGAETVRAILEGRR